MKRHDRAHLATVFVVLLLAPLFFRPAPPAPMASPSPTPMVFPSLGDGRGGIGIQVNLLEGTYEYRVGEPPKPGSSAVGVHGDQQAGPALNLRLAP